MSTTILALRFTHPKMDLSFLCELLSMQSTRQWLAGDRRQTPVGALLPGKNKISYWTSRLEFSAKDGFIEELKYLMNRVSIFRNHIQDFRNSGGIIEIYLMLSGKKNTGDSIDFSILKKLGEMEINFLVEVFPDC